MLNSNRDKYAKKKVLVVCSTDSMIWNFLVPHIQEMQRIGLEVDCACSITGSFFYDLVQWYSFNMYSIPFKRSPYNLANIKAYLMLIKLVRDNKYTTIFCHEPIGGLMGRLVGKKYKCNVIYMAHGFHFYSGAPKINWLLYYTLEKALSRITDVLITINNEDYKASLNFYAKQKIKINGIGVDTSKFKSEYNPSYIRNELKLSDDAIVVLSVGELIKRKNHRVIIDAIELLDDPKIHYVIVGDGILKQELQSIIEKLGVSEQVHLVGYRRDINKLCNSSDIFAFPSVQEGLSVALMEAMSCGKPIVASKIRGNVDLIDDGKGGFLISTYDASGYAEAIRKIIDNPLLEKNFGDYNVEKVKQFDIEHVKKQMEFVYKEI